MKKREIFSVAFIVIICAQFLYVFGAWSQPVAIGETVQKEPFESNPTAHEVNALTVTNPTYAYNGNLTTNYANFQYTGVNGSFVLKSFDAAGALFSNIGWVDFKISYKADGSTDDQYRIVYYVGASGPVVLQDWVNGTNAVYAKTSQFGLSGAQAHRTWSNQSKPDGGAWTWTDIGSVRVVFETNQVGGADSPAKSIRVYEVWLSIYENPLPLPARGLSVQPQFVRNLGAGTKFFVDIYISNVTNMLNYQIYLGYNTNVLTAIKYLIFGPLTYPSPPNLNDTGGYLMIGAMTYGGDPTGFTGSGPIARIYFTVDADGASNLHFYNVEAYTPAGHPISLTLQDGIFATSDVHNIAVTEVEANVTQVMPGASVAINVTVANQGTFNEPPTDVTVYFNSTPIGPSQAVALDLGKTQTVSFTWDTTGVPYSHYIISASASVVPGETLTSDNTLMNGMVIIGLHDIAVTKVIRAYPTQADAIPDGETLTVEKRKIVYVNVTVTNEGTFAQTFNVNASYTGGGHETQAGSSGDYVFETKPNVSLDPGASKNLTYAWDTASVVFLDELWVECRLRARASVVPYEANTTNNLFIDQKVNVTRPPIEAGFRIIEDEDSRLQGQPISFDAASSYVVAGTEFVSFEWDFGDGVRNSYVKGVNLTSPYRWTHVFTQTGKFDVTLKITNNLTQSDTTTQSLIVKSIDIAVVEIVKSATQVKRGTVVSINVTVTNQGDFWEDANVSAYAGKMLVKTLTVTSLINGTSKILRFSWNTSRVTPGTYSIKANATLLAGRATKEYDKSDNELVDGTVAVTYTRDIVVTSVKASSTDVTVGDSVKVSVKVENHGDWGNETFTVTLYYDDSEVDSEAVTALVAGGSTTCNFTWDTKGMSAKAYSLKAVATVSGDANPGDNTLVGDTVNLKEPTNTLLYIIIAAVAVVVVAVVLVYFLRLRKPKKPQSDQA